MVRCKNLCLFHFICRNTIKFHALLHCTLLFTLGSKYLWKHMWNETFLVPVAINIQEISLGIKCVRNISTAISEWYWTLWFLASSQILVIFAPSNLLKIFSIHGFSWNFFEYFLKGFIKKIYCLIECLRIFFSKSCI